MRTVYVDFETYYDSDYSLSKLQTDAYIVDDRYETIMVGVAIDDEQPFSVVGDEQSIKKKLDGLCDWNNVQICCHNTMFDGYILAKRYGINPRMWTCTQALSRMVHPYLRSHSLANMARYYKLQSKGTAVHNMKGVRLADMDADTFADYEAYCLTDVEICRDLHRKLSYKSPVLNNLLIDMTIRMFTEPEFVGDLDLMQDLYTKEVQRKEGLLALAQADRSEIMSSAKFAEKLRALGVYPPTKVSPRTGKTTFAFAKTDKEFLALQEHPDSEVQALVAARLGAKTTIAETRAERFIEMTKRGPLPVYLNYWGAKTTGRYSGGNKVNWQNLPARGISAGLRNALRAPEGHSVLVGDSSNIELRTVMALAGQTDVIKKLEAGVDMYCDFASRMFGREITKADKAERFLGKTAMLGLQYGAGAARFQEMANLQGKYIGAEPISMDRAYEIVELYRSVHYEVTKLWQHCEHSVLPNISNENWLEPVDIRSWFITQNEGFGRPGEPGVVYHKLRYKKDGWVYTMGRNEEVRIFGPKVVENLCQHAAMQIVMWQTARINQRYPVKLSVHDEAVCIVPDDELVEARAYMEECLNLTPKWCRGYIPVACETEVGASYGEAK